MQILLYIFFHLGEVAVAALASSEVPCILSILQRQTHARDVSDCRASKATRIQKQMQPSLHRAAEPPWPGASVAAQYLIFTIFGVFP